MRLFLAVEVPEKVKSQLDGQLIEIRKQYPEFNWVTPENFHITVYFFGEIKNTDSVKQRIKDLIYDQTEFHLYSTDVDVIANEKLLMYINFRREKKLESLAGKMTRSFDFMNAGRKYVPHLTIGRGRKSSKQQYFVLKKRAEKIPVDISFRVGKVVLYESIITHKRPVYRKIAVFPLLKN